MDDHIFYNDHNIIYQCSYLNILNIIKSVNIIYNTFPYTIKYEILILFLSYMVKNIQCYTIVSHIINNVRIVHNQELSKYFSISNTLIYSILFSNKCIIPIEDFCHQTKNSKRLQSQDMFTRLLYRF